MEKMLSLVHSCLSSACFFPSYCPYAPSYSSFHHISLYNRRQNTECIMTMWVWMDLQSLERIEELITLPHTPSHKCTRYILAICHHSAQAWLYEALVSALCLWLHLNAVIDYEHPTILPFIPLSIPALQLEWLHINNSLLSRKSSGIDNWKAIIRSVF